MSPRSYNSAATLGAPALLHTLTPEAETARQAIRAARSRKRDRDLVTEHPKRHSGHIPPAAERFVQAALNAGYRVKVNEGWSTINAGKSNETQAEAIQVQGINTLLRRGFRCTWVRGKAALGIWYAPGVGPFGDSVGITAVTAHVNGGA